MGLMMLFGVQDVFPMWLLLLAAIVMTMWEAREQRCALDTTLWWLLLVALVHVVGYIAMRGWVAWKHKPAQ